MSTITASEIKSGLVVFLDWEMLSEDPKVHQTCDNGWSKSRPFVCVETKQGHSTWAPLTSSYRMERLHIRPQWRYGGNQVWHDKDCYLLNGGTLLIGPNASFIKANGGERSSRDDRARIDQRGMSEIRREIAKQQTRVPDMSDSPHQEEPEIALPGIMRSQLTRVAVIYRELFDLGKFVSSVYPIPVDIPTDSPEEKAALDALIEQEKARMSAMFIEFKSARWTGEVTDFRTVPTTEAQLESRHGPRVL